MTVEWGYGKAARAAWQQPLPQTLRTAARTEVTLKKISKQSLEKKAFSPGGNSEFRNLKAYVQVKGWEEDLG